MPPVLVGRDVLLETGRRAFASAAAGRGRLVLLGGEAGIGKTTLAAALAEEAGQAGAQVRTGACWEQADGLAAFTPWLGALRDPGGDGCASAADGLEAADPSATDPVAARRALRRRFGEVVSALRTAAVGAPQVLVLEDLHWADSPSLELLAALAAHLPTMAVLVIGTYRDDELDPVTALGSIVGGAERLWLLGLESTAIAAILSDVLGRPVTDDEVAEVERHTAGNPLFVTEAARLLVTGAPMAPRGVRDVLERRLARLSSACDRVLGLAAVLGTEFDERVLEVMAGGPVGSALDEAAAARLLVAPSAAAARWRFSHALVQATRYDLEPSTARADAHRRALAALGVVPGTPAATLAHHASLGRFGADDPTPARLLVAAGQEALDRLAWSEAAASLERALTRAPAGPEGDDVRADAWLGLGAARLRQGGDDARVAFDEAAAAARRMGRADRLARAALGFGVGLGAFEVRLVDHHQIELLEEAARALEVGEPLLPLVLARLSVALAFVGSTERRTELAAQAIELARTAGDPVVLGHALAAWCDAMAGPEAVEPREAAASEIVRLAERAGDLPLELLGRRLRVVALMERGDWLALDAEVARYEQAAGRLGDPLYAWYGRLWRAARAHAAGRLDDSRRLVAEAAALGAEGASVNAAVLTVVLEGMAAIDRRDRAASDAAIESMAAAFPGTMSIYLRTYVAYASALLGDSARAAAMLDGLTDQEIRALPRDSEWLCSLIQLAVAASRVGDRRVAAVAGELLEPYAAIGCVEGIGAGLHGSAHRFLALTAALAGDVRSVRRHVELARRAALGLGPLVEGLVDLDGARALLVAGAPSDVEPAQALAAAAADRFAAVGIPALADEARSLAAAVAPATPSAAAGPSLARTGDTWSWTWEGTTVHARHAKGMADLALLVERSGQEVHVRELEAGAVAGGAQEVLDGTAIEQYRRRLRDLEEDLDEADCHADVGRAAQLAAERDALLAQLAGGLGLGGRPRRLANDPDERLRKAVSARVKASIERIEALHPDLGRHLRAAVRTGFWCSYRPEPPVTWDVRRLGRR